MSGIRNPTSFVIEPYKIEKSAQKLMGQKWGKIITVLLHTYTQKTPENQRFQGFLRPFMA